MINCCLPTLKLDMPQSDKVYGEAEFVSCNMLRARVQVINEGGEGDHGYNSCFEIIDDGSTGWDVSVRGGLRDGEISELSPKSVRINLTGTTEVETMINALRFIADTLEYGYENTEPIYRPGDKVLR